MNSSNRTKSVTIKHFFSFEGATVTEVYKLQSILKQLLNQSRPLCYAQKQGGTICIFLEDGTLFHVVTDRLECNKLSQILSHEKFLYGEIHCDKNISTDKYFLIDL